MTMRRSLLSAFLGAVLILSGTASSCGSTSDGSGVEVEDCDAEDFRNREADCGFTDSDRRKSPKPVVKPSPAKPAPRTTRR